MQIILLVGIACICSFAAVRGTGCLLEKPRGKKSSAALFLSGILVCLASSVVIECVMRAGRPTFYYHTHRPGTATVRIFGTACLTASLFYALLLITAERKKQRKTIAGWLIRTALTAFCSAVILEAGFFNFRHFELIGAHAREVSFSADRIVSQGLYFNRASWRFHPYSKTDEFRFVIYAGNRKVRNISYDFDDGYLRTMVRLSFNDKAHRGYELIPDHEFIQGIPRSFTIPLHTVGETYTIQLELPDAQARNNSDYGISLPQVVLNRTVPLTINAVRLGLTALAVFLIAAFFPGSPLWDLPLDLRAFPQAAAVGALLCGFFAFFVWTVFSSYAGSDRTFSEQKAALNENYQQYNKLVDALMVPQYALLETPHHELAKFSDVYDRTQRESISFGYPWDTVYYNGRFYVYFGVVPAVTVLLPYRLLTGEYLELDYPILGFCCLFALGLYGIYAALVRKYFSRITFGQYLIGLFLLITPLNLTWCLRRTLVYELAITSGICFAVWGIYFMLRAVFSERAAPVWFFLSGLSASLAVGCRPTMLPVSIPVFILGFFGLRERGGFFSGRNVRNIMLFLLPYILVGLALMKYNYERFGDPFEFGITYQLTTENRAVGLPLLGPFGRALGMLSSLFTLPDLDMNFPFIHPREPELPYNGMLLNYGGILGVFAWPLMLSLFLLPLCWKQMREKGRMLWAFLVSCLSAAAAICAVGAGVAILNRYLTDYMFLAALPAVFVLLCLFERCAGPGARKAVQAAALICAVIGGCLFAAVSLTGEGDWFRQINPLYFDRLRYALSPWL